ELGTRRQETFIGQQDPGMKDWQAQQEKLVEQEKAIMQRLGPEQEKRLRQIALQQLGPSAFGETEVVAALGLTVSQQSQIRGIQSDRSRPPWNGPGPRPAGRGPNVRPRGEDPRSSHLEKILAVLTAEQREKWSELVGEPFKGTIRPARMF